MTRNAAVQRAIAAICGTPGPRWPTRAVRDPDTGPGLGCRSRRDQLPAFIGRPEETTARLIVRRVKDANHLDALFPVWRYHPFLTNSELPTAEADITHRQHAIIETVSPTSSPGPWRTCPPGASAPTPPGSCAQRSPTTCSAPPESSPAAPTP